MVRHQYRSMASLQKNCNFASNVKDLNFVYNIGITVSWMLLNILAWFNPKIKKFVQGRKEVNSYLKSHLPKDKPVIWVHAASLGEFEQGLPVIELLRADYPEHSVLVTFFSPSGYEVRKNTKIADMVCYLPMDTHSKVQAFLGTVKPVLAIFIKYEIWPNYLTALKNYKTPIVLISAIFKERQVYFKWYGGFMRKALQRFSHIFVQNEESKALLQNLGINQVSISGDTRFDRVSQIREQENTLSFMEAFKRDRLCIVTGSTWPEDEEILIDYINSSDNSSCYVIAPHNIKADHINQLRTKLQKSTLLYSEITSDKLDEYHVLLVDTIGLLTRIYSYADIAYVGGGFATGLHNTLEPAVFGIPVLIGPQYHKFQEAVDLVHQKGIQVVRNKLDFEKIMAQLIRDEDFRIHTGLVNSNYIFNKRGASIQIMDYIRRLL